MTAADNPHPASPIERFGPAAATLDWHQPVFDDSIATLPPMALAAAVERRLEEPIAGPPLGALLRPPLLILVPDATRATGVRQMFTALWAYLDACGLPRADRQVLVAGGTHRAPRHDELEQLLGQSPTELRVEVHDAGDESQLIACGKTPEETPVLLNRAILDAGSTVLIGGITGHYFAGFTGGLKGIVPGAAAHATTLANHRLAVDPTSPDGLHPSCREGNLAGNPVHHDLVEAAHLVPPPFLINVVVGALGKPVGLVTGNPEPAHAAGVALARRAATPELAPAELVIVGTADAGRERDWIQAHKVARQGAAWVKDGGALIARLACGDGLGSSSLLDWFEVPAAELIERVHREYTLHGHTALAMRALCRRLQVYLVSELAPALVERLGMHPAPSVTAALAIAAERLPRGARAVALEQAGALLPPSTRDIPGSPQ